MANSHKWDEQLYPPKIYDVTSKDIEQCTVTENDIAKSDDLDVIDYCVKYTTKDLREKYMNWAIRFNENPPLKADFMKCGVFIMNIPQVNEEKAPALLKLLRKKLKPIICRSVALTEESFTIEICNTEEEVEVEPTEEAPEGDSSPKTKTQRKYFTFAYILFKNPIDAKAAAAAIDGVAITKKTMCSAVVAEDIAGVSERVTSEGTFKEPLADDIEKSFLKPTDDLLSWLCDPTGREQFLTGYGEKSSIVVKWNSPVLKEPEMASETLGLSAEWSPKGSYLISYHLKGILLRGGKDFQNLKIIEHMGVWKASMSPDERYLISWNGDYDEHTTVYIHDIFSGIKVKSIRLPATSCNRDDQWPYFLWSPDGRYLVMNDNKIWIMEAPTFDACVNDLTDEIWTLPCKSTSLVSVSPDRNLISVWSPGEDNCTFKIVNLDTRQEIARKTLNIDLDVCEVKWQAGGRFCALVMHAFKRVSKKIRTKYCQIEVFHIRLANSPSDSVIFDTETEEIKMVEFEPKSDVLSVLFKDCLKMYHLKRNVRDTYTREVLSQKLVHKASHIYWSPNGQFFLLGGQEAGMEAAIQFCSLKKNAQEEYTVDISHKDRHFGINNACWDASGRYVATNVICPIGSKEYAKMSESGYQIWTFQGRNIYGSKGELLNYFIWRPHAQSVLSVEQYETIKSNVETYAQKYNTTDADARSAAVTLQASKHAELVANFSKEVDHALTELHAQPIYAEWRKQRMAALGAIEMYEQDTKIEGVKETEKQVLKSTA